MLSRGMSIGDTAVAKWNPPPRNGTAVRIAGHRGVDRTPKGAPRVDDSPGRLPVELQRPERYRWTTALYAAAPPPSRQTTVTLPRSSTVMSGPMMSGKTAEIAMDGSK